MSSFGTGGLQFTLTGTCQTEKVGTDVRRRPEDVPLPAGKQPGKVRPRRARPVHEFLGDEEDDALVDPAGQELRLVGEAPSHEHHVSRPELVAAPLDRVAAVPLDQHHDFVEIMVMQFGHGTQRVPVVKEAEILLQIAPADSIFFHLASLPAR